MKKPNKPTKAETKKSKAAKPRAKQELSEEQLERVAGGAVSDYLKIQIDSVTISGFGAGGGAGKTTVLK
jgi:hypothetical protein